MPSRRSTASIDKTPFTKTNPLVDKIWKQQRMRTTDEQEQRINEEVQRCTCYQFDPRCWVKSGFSWEAHCKFCRRCRRWGDKDCELPQHQAERKKEHLTKISQVRATLGRVIRNNTEQSYRDQQECIHRFIWHGKTDIPWWVCFKRDCTTHDLAKTRNGIWPVIPTITIKNAQKCPCLREGCECNWIPSHPFHAELIPGSIFSCDRHKIPTIRKVSDESASRQLSVAVKVKGSVVQTIVDSGANVNYINEAWGKRMGIKAQDQGEGTIRANSGETIKGRIKVTSTKFSMNGKTMEHEFRVIRKTGSDNMLLGIPWLREENPMIDWQKEKITLIKEGERRETVSIKGLLNHETVQGDEE
jgi:hypothetical protein